MERVEVSEERREGRSWSTVKQVRLLSRDLFYSLHTRPEIADSRDYDTGDSWQRALFLNLRRSTDNREGRLKFLAWVS